MELKILETEGKYKPLNEFYAKTGDTFISQFTQIVLMKTQAHDDYSYVRIGPCIGVGCLGALDDFKQNYSRCTCALVVAAHSDEKE